MITSYIAQLRNAIGEVRPPVTRGQLKRLHLKRDYTGMVRFVRDTMKLDLRVRVGLVNESGVAGAPAWVSLPTKLPRYGSAEFKRTLVTVFIQKSFLVESNFESVVMAIAHELSHVVLFSIGHSLQNCEEAVDLTAMLLGYRDFYVAGSEYTEIPVHFGSDSTWNSRRRLMGIVGSAGSNRYLT